MTDAFFVLIFNLRGSSLVVQWLRLCSSTAEGADWIPGQRTKILHGSQCGQKIKRKIKKKSLRKFIVFKEEVHIINLNIFPKNVEAIKILIPCFCPPLNSYFILF